MSEPKKALLLYRITNKRELKTVRILSVEHGET